MFDRTDRDATAALITAFLNARLTAEDFEASNRLLSSRDPAVRCALEMLQELDDAYEQDVNALDKTEWDHLERMRLVLLSDLKMARRRRFIFESRQLLAIIGVAVFAAIWFLTGNGWHLLIPTTILGALTLLVCRFWPKRITDDGFRHDRITPFKSVRQLANVYKSVSFSKQRFPKRVRRNSKIVGLAAWLFVGILMAFFIPMWLAIFGLTVIESEYEVIPA